MAGEGETLIAAVRADPLLSPYADALEGYARSSIRLRPDHEVERFSGQSRVGGRPAVPVGFQWPKRHVEMPTPSPAWIASNYFEPRLLPPGGISAFQFIAQIDLAAVAPFDTEGLLPSDGTLLFFHDESYESDIDPDSGLKWTSKSSSDGGVTTFYTRHFGADQVDQVRVIHVPGGMTLRPRTTARTRHTPHRSWRRPIEPCRTSMSRSSRSRTSRSTTHTVRSCCRPMPGRALRISSTSIG